MVIIQFRKTGQLQKPALHLFHISILPPPARGFKTLLCSVFSNIEQSSKISTGLRHEVFLLGSEGLTGGGLRDKMGVKSSGDYSPGLAVKDSNAIPWAGGLGTERTPRT